MKHTMVRQEEDWLNKLMNRGSMTRIRMCINIQQIPIMPLSLLMTSVFLIPDRNITSTKGRFQRLYLLKPINLTLNKICHFPQNFLIETLTLEVEPFFSFTFDINFPKSNNTYHWVLLCCKCYWTWARISNILH